MVTLQMHTSVLERFPEQAEKIKLLLQQDESFAEICGDYHELALWLVAHDQDGCTPESECVINRELLNDLEIEILQFLPSVEHQNHRQV